MADMSDDNMCAPANVSEFGDTYTVMTEEFEESDTPVVFFCAKCRLPVGDSLSWAGTDELQNHILLREVSDNIVVGKEPIFVGKYKKMGCVIQTLSCACCSTMMGIMYVSTPQELDHRRSLFGLDVAKIDSYVLGSSTKKRPVLKSTPTPMTLEHRESVEQQINQVKTLTVALGQRLAELEAKMEVKPTQPS